MTLTAQKFVHYLRAKRVIAMALQEMEHPTLTLDDIDKNAGAILVRLANAGFGLTIANESKEVEEAK